MKGRLRDPNSFFRSRSTHRLDRLRYPWMRHHEGAQFCRGGDAIPLRNPQHLCCTGLVQLSLLVSIEQSSNASDGICRTPSSTPARPINWATEQCNGRR
jgi:hypothetical protein